MSASACPDLKYAKGRPKVLVKREKKAAVEAQDRAERKKCHIRSGGRCEVIEVIARPEHSALVKKRCKGNAVHNHHLIGGVGKRNVGISILADHRLDCCQRCHQDIEAEILQPANRDHAENAGLVTYERRTQW
jgi:hypothetical protein